MTRLLLTLLFTGMMAAGCSSETTPQQGPAPAVGPTDMPPGGGAPIGVTPAATPAADSNTETTAPAADGATAAATPVPVVDGVATLTPENTRIEFVGTHVGPTPDPNARTGTFADFAGQLNVDPAAKSVTGVSFDIKTESLTTAMDKLTNHLHSDEFLDVREFPSLTFESTGVTPGAAAGDIEIAGNLTLHGVTKAVTIPAKATVSDQGVSLSANFTIDRADYGMDQHVDKVEKVVTLSVKVGEKNVIPAAAAPPGQ